MSLFNGKVRLGYACINTSLPYTTNRGVKMATIKKLGEQEGVRYIKLLALQNLVDLLEILKWNEQNGIKVFRISSDIFPQIGNVEFRKEYPGVKYFHGDIDFAKSILKTIGQYATKHNMRLTFHSSPYMQLASPSIGVWQNTKFDLKLYSKIHSLLGLKNPCLILHGGGTYGDKPTTSQRWINRYKELPNDVRKIIMLENDEFSYSINDVLEINKFCGVPICFDMFHNKVSDDHEPLTKNLLNKVAQTWKDAEITIPKMHWSEQSIGKSRGAHSDYVSYLPDEFIDWAQHHKVDLMLECKMKEKSIFKLLQKYS